MFPVSLPIWYSFDAASISWKGCGWTRTSISTTCSAIGVTTWRPAGSVPSSARPKLATPPTGAGRGQRHGPAPRLRPRRCLLPAHGPLLPAAAAGPAVQGCLGHRHRRRAPGGGPARGRPGAGVVGRIWGALPLPAALPPVSLGPVLALPVLPTAAELGTALAVLVLPQLPLTLGNSVVSTAAVAQEYFGERAVRVTPRTLLRDMGLANLAAGLGGGIPLCHGAGGPAPPG